MQKKEEIRDAAIRLRVEGRSIRHISTLLGVSKGSVSSWTKGIVLNEEQRKALLRGQDSSRVEQGIVASLKAENRRKEYIGLGRMLAYRYRNDPMFSAGCFLYWGEGAKERSVRLINGDPELLLFFKRWLVTYFTASAEKLRVRLDYFVDDSLSERTIKDYWILKLGLSDTNFTKSTAKKCNSIKKDKHPYGFLTISLHSLQVSYMILGAIQEMAGFTRKDWNYD